MERIIYNLVIQRVLSSENSATNNFLGIFDYSLSVCYDFFVRFRFGTNNLFWNE